MRRLLSDKTIDEWYPEGWAGGDTARGAAKRGADAEAALGQEREKRLVMALLNILRVTHAETPEQVQYIKQAKALLEEVANG